MNATRIIRARALPSVLMTYPFPQLCPSDWRPLSSDYTPLIWLLIVVDLIPFK